MADPIQNAQFIQSLFAGVPAFVQRRGDQQANLAMLGLRRRWELEDQAAKAASARDITNLQSDRYIQMENIRSDRADKTAKETTQRMKDIEDERTARAEEKDAALRRRTAEKDARNTYAKYATQAADAGEPAKPFDSFGEDPDDAIAALNQEMSRLQGKQNDSAFEGMVSGYNQRFRALNLMSKPTAEDLSSVTQQVLGTMAPIDTKEENWAKAMSAIAGGSEKIGLALMGPQDRAAFQAERSKGLQALRILRTKDPAYINAARELSGMQQEIVKASFKNPKWAKTLGKMGVDDDAGAPAGAPVINLDSFLNAAGGKPKTSASTSVAAPSTSSPADVPISQQLDSGGVLGIMRNYGARLRDDIVPTISTGGLNRVGSWLMDNGQYLPGTLNYLAGGQPRLDAGDAERAEQLKPYTVLRDAYQRNQRTVNTTRDAILRALFTPNDQQDQ